MESVASVLKFVIVWSFGLLGALVTTIGILRLTVAVGWTKFGEAHPEIALCVILFLWGSVAFSFIKIAAFHADDEVKKYQIHLIKLLRARLRSENCDEYERIMHKLYGDVEFEMSGDVLRRASIDDLNRTLLGYFELVK